MCEPVSIAAAAAMVVGSVMQTNEQNRNIDRMQKAKNRAFAENAERQKGYANEVRDDAMSMIDRQGSESFDETLQSNTDKRLKAFTENQIQSPDYSFASPNMSKNVALAQEQTFGEANEKTQRDNENLAKLSSYGGTLFDTGLARNEYARKFGDLSAKAFGDNRMLGMQIQSAANNAYRPPSLFPTLLKSGGQMGMMYGAKTPYAGSSSVPVEDMSTNYYGNRGYYR